MPRRGFLFLQRVLSVCFLGAWLARPALALATTLYYQTITVPPGRMTIDVPLNAFLGNDYLSIPVVFKQPYRIGKYRVTLRQWEACRKAGGCDEAGERTKPGLMDHPVVRVDWHQAQAFARWLSKATGRHYRLPTEQEWFYAATEGKGFKVEARPQDLLPGPRGPEVPKQTLPVGAFGQNAWGMADVTGNVWDWTLNCHTLSPQRLLEPTDPAKLQDPACCSTRIVAGETRAHVPDFVADTYNGGCATSEPVANLGFRRFPGHPDAKLHQQP
jgi:formylglycine-generating enzyme required for sulfatase activity